MTDLGQGDRTDDDDLLGEAVAGRKDALDSLLGRHRERLHRMIALRLDRRLQGRLDASDVIQEAFLEAYDRFPEFVRNRPASFFLWLRFLTRQKLVTLHRRHIGTQGRDPRREVALGDAGLSPATSESLAARLLGTSTSPSQAAVRAELKAHVEEALGCMSPLDREVLALRHFEQLSNAETAQELGISEAAASKRYIRAARRMKDVLSAIRSFSDGSTP
jgi:RNA polymerase sigma-70 factor (ECF subfamily)